jgi:cytochrome c
LLRLFAGLAAVLAAGPALAQFELPPASKPDPAALFRSQCGTCHSLNPADPPRQGPSLAGLIGRHAGSVAGFHYSPGLAKADFDWDAAHLDAYLTNPQSVVPGAVMPYRQANAATRQSIIGYLQEQK